eukprot:318280_1
MEVVFLFLVTGLFTTYFLVKHWFGCTDPSSISTKRDQKKSMNSEKTTMNIHLDHDDPLVLYAQIKANNDQLSLDAIEFIKRTLVEYTPDHLAFSFNGGKDCMVLLYLIRIALKLLNKNDEDLEIIWFQRSNEFPQLIEFLRYCVKKYQFPLFETCNDYKHGLVEYLKNGNPLCHGVFLGQRTTDPWCSNLHLSTHCTSGWPDIMRINPILFWNYHQIWDFLLRYNLEYCCLYDQGYTSLGGIEETIPNPLLYDRHLFKFKPASQLNTYEHAERFGRLIKNKHAETSSTVIRDKIKCLIVGNATHINAHLMDNIKSAIDSSFVNGILDNKHKLSVDLEVIETDENGERLQWCKMNYLYTFYAKIVDDLR